MKKIVILEDNEYEAEGLINDISFELGQKGHNRFSLELAHDIDELNEKLFNNRGLKEEYNDLFKHNWLANHIIALKF